MQHSRYAQDKMNWISLKNKIYFEDGSLRDILIPDFKIEDWKQWSDLINSKYKVEFYNGQTKSIINNIDFGVVMDFWSGKTDLINSATIYLDNITVKCHFFDDKEFENDIDPREFNNLDDDLSLMNYLKDISCLLKKTIYLTDENSTDSILIKINENEINYSIK